MDKIIIAIDTGVNTGFALWNITKQQLEDVRTMKIHQAMALIEGLHPNLVRVEDARLRTFIPKGSGRERLQNVGSVKRDAKIFEDFLTDKGIRFELVAPKYNTTKLSSDEFKRRTGWLKTTNEHGRDAAMMCYGFTERNLEHTLRLLK